MVKKDKGLQDFNKSRSIDKFVGIKMPQADYDELKAHCEDNLVSVSKYIRYLYETDRERRLNRG